MNKAFKNNWYLFLLGAIGASAIICGGIAIRTSPTKKEKILFYVSALEVDTSVLVKECKSVTNDDIRQIRVNHESVQASDSSRLFGMVYDSTDIYIYPASQLERTAPLSIHFTQEKIVSYLPNSLNKELKSDNDNCYAIKIYDAQTNTGALTSIIDYRINENDKEDYYLSFFKSSLHIGELNNSSSKNALTVANHLLEL